MKKGAPEFNKQKQQEKVLEEDNSNRRSKLRNADALNVSTFEARTKDGEDDNKHDLLASFEGLNKSVDIEELRKGVPEFNKRKQQEMVLEEDSSQRKSKLRNPEALNVSTFEGSKNKNEDEEDKHGASFSYEGLYKSVDIEDLKKGVPQYHTKTVAVVVEDNSHRRSKPRNANALNVSTFESSKNKNEDEEDKHGASFSYEGLNKSVNIEDLKKGVPNYPLKTEKPETVVVVEDNSKRKSKLRGPDALNVSTFEGRTASKDDEDGNKHDVSAPFEGLNKSVDVEDLKKGVPEYRTKGQEVQVQIEDNSQRRSKLRNPDALNVSTFEASSKVQENKLDTSTPLNPLDQGVNIEELKKGVPTSVLPKNILKGSEGEEKPQSSETSAAKQNEAADESNSKKKKAFATKADAKSFIDDLVKQNFNKEDLKSSFSLLNRSVDLKHDLGNRSLLDDHMNKSFNILPPKNTGNSEAEGRLLQENEGVSIVSQGRRQRPKRPERVLQHQQTEPEKEQNTEPLRTQHEEPSKQETPECQGKRRHTEGLKNPFPTPAELKRIRASKKPIAFKFCKELAGLTKFAMRSHGRFMFNLPLDAEHIDSPVDNFSVTEEGPTKITIPVYITKDNKSKFGSKGQQRKLFGFKIRSDVMFRSRKEKQVNKQVFCSNCEEFIRIEETNSHVASCTVKTHSERDFSQQLPQVTLSELNKRILAIVNKNNQVIEEFNVRPQFMTICKRLGEISVPAADESTKLDKLDTLMKQFDNVFSSLAELELQEDELDMIIYLQRLFVSLQDKADLLKHAEETNDSVHRQFNSEVLKELQDKDVRQKDYFKLKTKPGNLHKLENIDSDIASSVDTEMTFVGSEAENWVEYEPRSNSKDKESSRRHFYIQAVNIKLALPASHPAREIVISKLYDKAVKEKVPKESWIEFIKREFKVEF